MRSHENEKSACGVGFLVSLKNEATNKNLTDALNALSCQEHRGGCGYDGISSDGSGIMTDIPFDMFGFKKGEMAIATLLIPLDSESQRIALSVLHRVFKFLGLEIESFREVPIDSSCLGYEALRSMPSIKQVFIRRPKHCRTNTAFNHLLYAAKQITRLKASDKGLKEFFFASISTTTIVYKALTRANMLNKFYLDLQDPSYKTRFTLFHRRFSTNTRTSWDKAQPFRIIAHNGEINTISGNRSWGYSREKGLGLKDGELISHTGISDTGTLNEMTEALLYKSSIPYLEEVMAIMVPPASDDQNFYKFWSRAMESWDGPAFISFSNGNIVGARLDRNGFRPCRWATTDTHFYLSSEAGPFEINEEDITAKGTLHAGTGVVVKISSGEVRFSDPCESRHNFFAKYDPHLIPIEEKKAQEKIYTPNIHESCQIFGYTREEVEKYLTPMIATGKEPIGSMGDTASLAIFSKEPRPIYDYFYQNFAQVTNPPVDYLREGVITDLRVYLGPKPNIFSPKELMPMPAAFQLERPILTLAQADFLLSICGREYKKTDIKVSSISTLFKKSEGEVGFNTAIRRIENDCVEAVKKGASIIILSDANATRDSIPIPALIALRACTTSLSSAGLRLSASIVSYTGDVRTPHQLSMLVGFGATAVCPYLALQFARYYKKEGDLDDIEEEKNETNLIKAFEQGILKVMSKMGISVARSYEGAKLYGAIGLGPKLMNKYFLEVQSPIGGIEIPELVGKIISNAEKTVLPEYRNSLINPYLFKEFPRGTKGERHYMTSARSKSIHKLVRNNGSSLSNPEIYHEYLKLGIDAEPISLRHVFSFKPAKKKLEKNSVEPLQKILKTFGSGGMSFGAISAESQRDIFLAMKEIGGRSNSGEGGENPYYYKSGIQSTSKQVASGRFGVTTEYLVSGEEIQIKIAQGAKPGEGGQLMSPKVDEDIARARHAKKGIDLISPPPLHDIYSIEDLKELIYELRQVNPSAKICVKLVAGINVGTISVGVVKAGADIIHISGNDGGTGAASLSSMKHAGLPWEIGLWEVHRELVKHKLRKYVVLRTDGGLSTGKDIVTAAILGAEEYDFGKLLLIAEGCIMARICEKNTCPTGIATHNPKFKAKYKGSKDHIVRLLEYIADDARSILASQGFKSLSDIIGRTDLLTTNPSFDSLIVENNLDFSFFLKESFPEHQNSPSPFKEGVSSLNKRILEECMLPVTEETNPFYVNLETYVYDRAAMATLSGEIANLIRKKRQQSNHFEKEPTYKGNINLSFRGSAGQGFGVFMTQGITARLYGEANDSVCKSMCGGKAIITAAKNSNLDSSKNVIIGNCALYGATGGVLYVSGIAGDRFAVRNSGATAVVEGVGLHACEYMTDGYVVILGPIWHNLGAGMTGGKTLLYQDDSIDYNRHINQNYIKAVPMNESDFSELKLILKDYLENTKSIVAKKIIDTWAESKYKFWQYLPIKEASLISVPKKKNKARKKVI